MMSSIRRRQSNKRRRLNSNTIVSNDNQTNLRRSDRIAQRLFVNTLLSSSSSSSTAVVDDTDINRDNSTSLSTIADNTAENTAALISTVTTQQRKTLQSKTQFCGKRRRRRSHRRYIANTDNDGDVSDAGAIISIDTNSVTINESDDGDDVNSNNDTVANQKKAKIKGNICNQSNLDKSESLLSYEVITQSKPYRGWWNISYGFHGWNLYLCDINADINRKKEAFDLLSNDLHYSYTRISLQCKFGHLVKMGYICDKNGIMRSAVVYYIDKIRHHVVIDVISTHPQSRSLGLASMLIFAIQNRMGYLSAADAGVMKLFVCATLRAVPFWNQSRFELENAKKTEHFSSVPIDARMLGWNGNPFKSGEKLLSLFNNFADKHPNIVTTIRRSKRINEKTK